jgi:hypothetical protein
MLVLMNPASTARPSPANANDRGPILDVRTRLRLGLQLQALYEPMFDDVLDPRLAALLQQLESDQSEKQTG